MKKYLLIVVAILSLTSCAVQYNQPQIVQQAIVRDANPVDSLYDIAKLSWREFYKDPVLCAHIDSALVNNYDLDMAIKRMEQAAAYFKQSKAAFAPSLSAAASAGWGKADLTSPQSPYFSLGVNMSWELDIWGKIRHAKRGKYNDLLAQESSKNAVITGLVANVAIEYYTLMMLDAQKAFVLESIKNREDYLATVKELKKSAKVNEVAVLQAEAELMNVKSYLPDIEKAIYATENAMSILMGALPGTIRRDTLAKIYDVDFYHHEVGIPADFLRNRPDVLAAEYQVKSSLAKFNSAKAAMYPTLSITGNVSSDAAMITQWFAMPSSLVYGVAGGLLQPIFNARALKTQKEVAYKEFEIATKSFEKAVLSAGVEVSDILFTLKNDRQKVLYMKDQTAALDKAYEYSLELLINGYASYLDVLSAQNGVFNSKIALIQGYQACINDMINLYRALGGGWR